MANRVKINGRYYGITAVNFELVEQYQSNISPTIRTYGDIVIPIEGKIVNVSLSLEFSSAYSINEDMRRLYAMFLRIPIWHIQSSWLKALIIDGIDEEYGSLELDNSKDKKSIDDIKRVIEENKDVLWVAPLTFNATFTGPRSINVQMNITPIDIIGINVEPYFLLDFDDVEKQTEYIDYVLSVEDKYTRTLLKEKSGNSVSLNDDEDQRYMSHIIDDIKKAYKDTIDTLNVTSDPSLSKPFRTWYQFLLEEYRNSLARIYPDSRYPLLSRWEANDKGSSITLTYPILKTTPDDIKREVRKEFTDKLNIMAGFIESWNLSTANGSNRNSIFAALKGEVSTLLDPLTYFSRYQGTVNGNINIPITKFLTSNYITTLLEKLKEVPKLTIKSYVIDATDPIVNIDGNVYKGESVYQHLSSIISSVIDSGDESIIKGIMNVIWETLYETYSQYDFIFKNFDFESLYIAPTDAVPTSITISVDNKMRMLKLVGKTNPIPQSFGTSSPVIKLQVRTQNETFIQKVKEFRMKYEAAQSIQRRFNYFLSFLKDLRLDIKISSNDKIFEVFGIHNVVLTDISFRPDTEQSSTIIIELGFIQSDLGRNMYEVYGVHQTRMDNKIKRFFAYIWASALNEYFANGGCEKNGVKSVDQLLTPLELIKMYEDYPTQYIEGGDFLSGGDAVSMDDIINMLRSMQDNGIDLLKRILSNDNMVAYPITPSGTLYNKPEVRYVHTWNMDVDGDGSLTKVTINPIESHGNNTLYPLPTIPKFDIVREEGNYILPAGGSEFIHVTISTILYILEELCQNMDPSDFKVMLSLFAYQTVRDIVFSNLFRNQNWRVLTEADAISSAFEDINSIDLSGAMNESIINNISDDVWQRIVDCINKKTGETSDVLRRGATLEHFKHYFPIIAKVYDNVFGDNNLKNLFWMLGVGVAETGLSGADFKSNMSPNSAGACGLFQIRKGTGDILIKKYKTNVSKWVGKDLSNISWSDICRNDILSTYFGMLYMKELYERYSSGGYYDITDSVDLNTLDLFVLSVASEAYNRGHGKVDEWISSNLKVNYGDNTNNGRYTYEQYMERLHNLNQMRNGKKTYETYSYITTIHATLSCILRNMANELEANKGKDFYDRYKLEYPIDFNEPGKNEHRRIVLCASGTDSIDSSNINEDVHFIILNGNEGFGYNESEDGHILSVINIDKRINYANNPDNNDILIMLVGSPESASYKSFSIDFENTGDVFSNVYTEKQGVALAYLLHAISEFYNNPEVSVNNNKKPGPSQTNTTGSSLSTLEVTNPWNRWK